MRNTDLHSHSNYSNGLLSVKDLIKRAKDKGIVNLALTDYNTTEGINFAIEQGLKFGVNIIPGVEIKVKEGEILGYFINIENKLLQSKLAEIRRLTYNSVEFITLVLQGKGYNINIDDLRVEFFDSKDNLCERHIIYYLVKKKMCKTIKEANRLVFKDKVVQSNMILSAIDAIKLIKNSGGVSVLANPWLNNGSRELLNDDKIKNLMLYGLVGIEIESGSIEKRNNEIVENITSLALRQGLIICSGSDFYGDFLLDINENQNVSDLGSHNSDESIIKILKGARKDMQTNLNF